MNTRIKALALAATLGVATLAGCGSSDDDAKTTSTTASTPAAKAGAEAKGAPIVIGTIGSYTGPLAGTAGSADDVMLAWAKWRNANGGINGHPVKVIALDDGQNPAKAIANVKQLVEKENVMAIVGEYSLASAAWEKYVLQKRIPIVGGVSTDTPFLSNPMFFPAGSTLTPMLYGQLKMAADAGNKKLGTMFCAETPVCAQLVPLLQGLGKAAGIDVTGQKVSSSAPNYTAPCLKLKQEGADALFVAASSSAVPRIVKSCNQQGFKPTNIASNSTVDLAWLKEPALDGTLISGTNVVYDDESVPGVKSFIEAVDTYLPGLRDTQQFTLPLLFAWAGGELFAKAAEAAKIGPDSTNEDVLKGLYALKDETLDGIAPPLNFVKDQPTFTPCYFPSKISDGKVVSTNDNQPVCLDATQAQELAAALGG